MHTLMMWKISGFGVIAGYNGIKDERGLRSLAIAGIRFSYNAI